MQMNALSAPPTLLTLERGRDPGPPTFNDDHLVRVIDPHPLSSPHALQRGAGARSLSLSLSIFTCL